MKIKLYFFTVLFIFTISFSIAQVHTTYLWHLQQPIYWPEESLLNSNRYQTVKESFDIKNSGGNNYGTGTSHPLNDLQEIFSKDDRRIVYQEGTKNSLQTILSYGDAGVQVNYSGVLIENVNSLADAGMWGYFDGWENNFKTARSWTTSDGFPKMDVVGFSFHHVISPLVSERALEKEIMAHHQIYNSTFGTSPVEYSQGYWPAEGCFSERIIKVLVEQGFEWSVIANSHLSRTLADYPLSYGTSVCNIDPPNLADKVAANGTNWWGGQIDGRGGQFAAPYCYQAHKAKYVDPETGTEYKIDVVPMCDLLSYRDGYSAQGTGDIKSKIVPYNNPSQPSITLFCHDGDNAWGGGASYYQEAVPGFTSSSYSDPDLDPTTISQFLFDHPVPASDVVHVEDGGWVNAENDWGHPQFINWLWPLYDATTMTFNPNGWTEDARNWAVVTAVDNYTCMAEDLEGSTRIAHIVSPNSSSTEAEKAWHFYLPTLASCYMYYGKALDMEVKQTIAGNNAIEHAQIVINAHTGTDNTPPSVFAPQRFPYNPGSKGFGPLCGYQEKIYSKNFTIWTFGYDVSGISTAVLKYRTDDDGINPETTNVNDVYANGTGVSAWNSTSMTLKDFPTGNVANDPEIDFFVLPTAIADLYYAEITGLESVLVDYYVEMTDTKGNTFKSAIFHVWVGNEEGGGGTEDVYWEPTSPTQNNYIEIFYTDGTANSILHWGVTVAANNWVAPIAAYQPSGTVPFSSEAVQTPFTDPDSDGLYSVVLGPFNNASQVAEYIDFTIKPTSSTWYGQDFRIKINEPESDNPTSANKAITISKNQTYTFSTSDFTFFSPISASFAGIKIISLETAGSLKYNSADVVTETDYSNVGLLTFTPELNATGSPYATFTFKVKDSGGNYSDNTYTITINISSPNPSGANKTISLMMNQSHTFGTNDFTFSSSVGATFAGIQIVNIQSEGTLKYNGADVVATTDYPNVALLVFTPENNATGTPYSTFTFKVKDSFGNYSDATYTTTINVTNTIPAGVSWYPENPTQNDVITVYVKGDASMTSTSTLHWAVNDWISPITGYRPANTTYIGPAVETVFTYSGEYYYIELGPFNDPSQVVEQIDFVLHYGGSNWNNNSDNNWLIPVEVVTNGNPVSANNSIFMIKNQTQVFSETDFEFNSSTGAGFAGIKILSYSSDGFFKYNGVPVNANTDYEDVSLLTFQPFNDDSGLPYFNFTFKVKDDQGNYSDANYTCTVYVTETAIASGVSWQPASPDTNDEIVVFVKNDASMNTNSRLHWGVNKVGSNWTTPNQVYWPAGSVLSSPAVQSPFTEAEGFWFIKLIPFNNAAQAVSSLHFVIYYGSSLWNNNGGADWNIPITASVAPTGSNEAVTIYANSSYSFTFDDFTFNSSQSNTFAGIKIISIETKGDLDYNGTDVTAGLDCPVITQLSYTPLNNEFGNNYATFTFKVKDDAGNYSDDNYTMVINVLSVNPLSSNSSVSMYMNSTYDFELTDFPFTGINGSTFNGIKIVDIETQGNLEYNSNPVSVNTDYVDIQLLSFTPVDDEFASPYTTFTFKVKDNNGNYSSSVYTMTINVLDILPTGANKTVSMYINETYNFSLTDFTFNGVNGALFNGIKIVDTETNGTLLYNETDVLSNTDYTDVSLLTFTPDLDEFASPYTTFTFKVKDSNGNYSSANYTMTINVLDVTPTGANEQISMYMNDIYIFNSDDFTFSGVESAIFNGIKIIDIETDGDLEYNSTDVTANTDYSDVSLLSFIPVQNEFSSPYATFTFRIKDSNGNYSTSVYTMTINVVEALPTGANSSVTMYMNDTFSFSETDFPFTGINDASFAGIKIISVEIAGDLEYDNSDVLSNTDYSDVTLLEFTPNSDEFGSPYSLFTFMVKDSNGSYSTAVYTMTINVLEETLASVYWLPENPDYNDEITVYVENDSKMGAISTLYWGVNKSGNMWTAPNQVYWPENTDLFNGIGPAVETPFEQIDDDLFSLVLGPFNSGLQTVSSVHFKLHYDVISWNNNNGLDWNIPIQTTGIEQISNFDISISPNPFDNYTVIRISDDNYSNYNVTLSDITGKIIQTEIVKSNESYVLYRNNFMNGIYLIKFENQQTSEIKISKVIIY